ARRNLSRADLSARVLRTSLIEQRKILRRLAAGEGVQPSPHVDGLLVGEEGGRGGRHVVRRLAQERPERLDGEFGRGGSGGRGSGGGVEGGRGAGGAVGGEGAFLGEDDRAAGGVAVWGERGPGEQKKKQTRRENANKKSSHAVLLTPHVARYAG